MEEILRQLMEESYGALAWLQGLQLSDGARAYKVKKLQEALAAAEAYLQTPTAPGPAESPQLTEEQAHYAIADILHTWLQEAQGG